ncbi:ATP-binding protein [Marinobacter sp. ST-43]|uniref:ATP-binding protein n=1 Tax=Marinobacter sp. ST-43 TaxID=3050453 RepID=UPI0026DED6E4|nr:ATP-binding protein [Marinobacter sp. ST-43]
MAAVRPICGCALANQACRHGLSVRYFRTSRLLESLSIAHGDGGFAKLILLSMAIYFDSPPKQ